MNETELTFSISQLLGCGEHLAGATLGERCRDAIVQRLFAGSSAGEEGKLVVLDFAGISSATASFLKATVVWLLRAGMSFAEGTGNAPEGGGPTPLNIYPAVKSLSDDLLNEFGEVLGNQRLPCLEITLIDGSAIRQARLLGELEQSLRRTLGHLRTLESATAAQLHEQFREERVQVATVWNNRLTELHRLRLVRRKKEGRTWVFEALAKEIING